MNVIYFLVNNFPFFFSATWFGYGTMQLLNGDLFYGALGISLGVAFLRLQVLSVGIFGLFSLISGTSAKSRNGEEP